MVNLKSSDEFKIVGRGIVKIVHEADLGDNKLLIGDSIVIDDKLYKLTGVDTVHSCLCHSPKRMGLLLKELNEEQA